MTVATLSEHETWAVLRLAFWHLQRRRFSSAERLARGLLRLDIHNGWAWYYYGEARREQGDAREAQKGYEQAAHILRRPEIYLRLAEVCLAIAERPAARAALEEAARLDPAPDLRGRIRALKRRAEN